MKKWICDCLMNSCISCQTLSNELLCADCKDTLTSSPPACWSCARPIVAPHQTRCGPCLHSPPAWDSLHVLHAFTPEMAQLIHRIKFSFAPHLAHYLGTLLGEHVEAFHHASPVDLIIPVPLHRLRLARRSYNQAECIARGVAKHLSIPLNNRALKRIRHTKAQAKLSNQQQRKANLHSAFEVHAAPAAKHIALIDDVITTGSTLNACIAAWQTVSPARFSVWCVARA